MGTTWWFGWHMSMTLLVLSAILNIFLKKMEQKVSTLSDVVIRVLVAWKGAEGGGLKSLKNQNQMESEAQKPTTTTHL